MDRTYIVFVSAKVLVLRSLKLESTELVVNDLPDDLVGHDDSERERERCGCVYIERGRTFLVLENEHENFKGNRFFFIFIPPNAENFFYPLPLVTLSLHLVCHLAFCD